ncbi:hypothetical protein HPB47_003616, partial [Ixodes persulcatus]
VKNRFEHHLDAIILPGFSVVGLDSASGYCRESLREPHQSFLPVVVLKFSGVATWVPQDLEILVATNLDSIFFCGLARTMGEEGEEKSFSCAEQRTIEEPAEQAHTRHEAVSIYYFNQLSTHRDLRHHEDGGFPAELPSAPPRAATQRSLHLIALGSPPHISFTSGASLTVPGIGRASPAKHVTTHNS